MNRLVREILQTLRRERIQVARQGGGGHKLFSPYVFCSAEGHFLHNFYRDWYPALRRAAIPDFRFHDLRHTFASRLVMAGVDLLTVQTLLGHKTPAMTLRHQN